MFPYLFCSNNSCTYINFWKQVSHYWIIKIKYKAPNKNRTDQQVRTVLFNKVQTSLNLLFAGPSYVRKQYLQQLAKELKGQHLTITTLQVRYTERYLLSSTHSTILQNPPLSYTEYENNKLVGKGIAFEFIKFFQKKYGFTYSILLPDDDLIGNAEKGIFGLLSKNVSSKILND